MRHATSTLLRVLLTAGTIGLWCSTPSANAAPAEGYSIVKKISIPGDGSWDYLTVDEGARRLYVTHGTQVQVIDVDSGNIVGSIPNKLGVHGVAIAAELGRGFVSDGK